MHWSPSLWPLLLVGGKDGHCGPGFGSCASGYCCSPEGWCGLTSDYCSAPDCLINYGTGCDGNQRPSGADTSSVPRPHVGSVLYGGVGIYDCVNAGEIAVTFDDGPYKYTGDLLDKFASYGAKATFFITGNNLGKGMINDPSKPWADYIRRMIAEGHQVASHTWSHQNASELTHEQYRAQILWNEIAFNDILGYFPTYMRPPYSICPSYCQKVLSELGYHITYFDLDTEGYLHDDRQLIQDSKDIWDDAIDRSDPSSQQFLMIEHDIHYQTVYNLTDYVLTSLFARGYRSVTVGECLGDPPENWYRAGPGSSVTASGSATATDTVTVTSTLPPTDAPPIPSTTIFPPHPTHTGTDNGGGSGSSSSSSSEDQNLVPDRPIQSLHASSTPALPAGHGSATAAAAAAGAEAAPPPSASSTRALALSQDGTCGGNVTCLGSPYGNCCSAHGWCGSSQEYCGKTCQPSFGACADSPRR